VSEGLLHLRLPWKRFFRSGFMEYYEIGLFAILAAVLFLPFLVHQVEQQLEIFLFIMGVVSVTITSQWSFHLFKESLVEPVKITLAVFVAGIFFSFFRKPINRGVTGAVKILGIRGFVFGLIVVMGLLSSVITAIIAALVLVEIISTLRYERKMEINVVICTCFAIGLGAALTPIGEPLSTITISKLAGEPYHAGFFFLLKNLWVYIIPGIVLFAILGARFSSAHDVKKMMARDTTLHEKKPESIAELGIRSLKVYLFIMALVYLGKGFNPIVDAYVSVLPKEGLYWLNMISAVVDNATLASAEIAPSIHLAQIKAILLGLLISGGMLIPGNIPNIIAAGKLNIKSREWARLGVPLGLIVMLIYFIPVLLGW
jgi:predicted cation transporter